MLFTLKFDTEEFGNDYEIIGALLVDLGRNLQRATGDITEKNDDGQLFQAVLRHRKTNEPVLYIAVTDEPIDKTKWGFITEATHTATCGTGGADLHAIDENPNVKH